MNRKTSPPLLFQQPVFCLKRHERIKRVKIKSFLILFFKKERLAFSETPRFSDRMDQLPEPVVFEAEVTPHRSLSRRGLRLVIGFMFGVSLCTTSFFWHMGAWPIAGFNGGEVLLAIALLRMHALSNKQRETLLLSRGSLRILRTDRHGRGTERVIAPGWLSVLLLERPGRVPGLFLSARGEHVEIGSALGEPEKRDLAEALSAAVHRLKNPVFDNPQLRPNAL